MESVIAVTPPRVVRALYTFVLAAAGVIAGYLYAKHGIALIAAVKVE